MQGHHHCSSIGTSDQKLLVTSRLDLHRFFLLLIIGNFRLPISVPQCPLHVDT